MDLASYLSEPLPFDKEIDKYIRDNKSLVILEVGACEGEDTIKIRRKFPKAVYHAFEPLPANIQRLNKNLKKYKISGVQLHQLALSDQDDVAEFYVSSGHPDDLPKTKGWDYGNKSSSLLAPKEHLKTHKWLKFNEKIKVKTQRLDSFCKTHDIDHIDFAHIDVQGAELMVLAGAGEFMKKIKVIWLEVGAIELYAHQPLKPSVENFMREWHFKCVKDTVDAVAGDQMYINASYYKELL